MAKRIDVVINNKTKENMNKKMKNIIGTLLILPLFVIMVGGMILLLIEGDILLEAGGLFLLVLMALVGASILDSN